MTGKVLGGLSACNTQMWWTQESYAWQTMYEVNASLKSNLAWKRAEATARTAITALMHTRMLQQQRITLKLQQESAIDNKAAVKRKMMHQQNVLTTYEAYDSSPRSSTWLTCSLIIQQINAMWCVNILLAVLVVHDRLTVWTACAQKMIECVLHPVLLMQLTSAHECIKVWIQPKRLRCSRWFEFTNCSETWSEFVTRSPMRMGNGESQRQYNTLLVSSNFRAQQTMEQVYHQWCKPH